MVGVGTGAIVGQVAVGVVGLGLTVHRCKTIRVDVSICIRNRRGAGRDGALNFREPITDCVGGVMEVAPVAVIGGGMDAGHGCDSRIPETGILSPLTPIRV